MSLLDTPSSCRTSPNCSSDQILFENDKIIIERVPSSRISHPIPTSYQSSYILIKSLNSQFPSAEAVSRLRYEFEAWKDVELEDKGRPFALVGHENGLSLVYEDIGGLPLTHYISYFAQCYHLHQNMSVLTELLQLILCLCKELHNIHQAGFIYKSLCPYTIIYNPSTHQCQFLDFSLSSLLSMETNNPDTVSISTQLLPYISPEMTGRMNRSIETRTDFYSLGCIIYELIMGQPPFVYTDDELEIMWSHIAKPIPALPSYIPNILQYIIYKLLAKAAEERYQSAIGIQADIEYCIHFIQENGHLNVSQDMIQLVVGQADIQGSLKVSQKLYGRQEQVNELLTEFELEKSNFY